jgi:hypothetical protein
MISRHHTTSVFLVRAVASATLGMLASGCVHRSANRAPEIPFASHETPELTLVWVGTGTSYRVSASGRTRTPASDYTFTVTQRRFATHWESRKELHRADPAYDGSAGPRDQSYVFRLDMAAQEGNSVAVRVRSTLGDGNGSTDAQFRNATLEFAARGVSRFAPYNTFRIAQRYEYEAGTLSETVTLFKRRDGADVRFVETDEQAQLFAPRQFAQAPTQARPK